jgi:pimeloyl-ACP methyl ester carboxylesterase
MTTNPRIPWTHSAYRSSRGRAEIRGWCERRLDCWQVPHERHELETAAGQTHLLIAGQPDTGTVLYLPGTNFNAATSLSLAQELASRARVVVADLPGQPGLSAGERPRGDRLAAYGAWAGEVVQQVRQAFGQGPLMVVGHSLGAAVALAAPVTDISTLALVNPAGLVRLRVPPAILWSTLAWLVRPSERTSTAMTHHLLGPGRQPQPHLAEWMTLVARHTRPAGAPGPLAPELLTRWQQRPRLVVSGERDCFLPAGNLGRAVEERLGVPLVVLPGLGHLSVADDPRSVSALLLTAFDAGERSSAGPTRTEGTW